MSFSCLTLAMIIPTALRIEDKLPSMAQNIFHDPISAIATNPLNQLSIIWDLCVYVCSVMYVYT